MKGNVDYGNKKMCIRDRDTTEDDLLKLLEEYEVAYTAEDYNGTPKKRCYNIAFEEGAAVSYTHLDVYKRQEQEDANMAC